MNRSVKIQLSYHRLSNSTMQVIKLVSLVVLASFVKCENLELKKSAKRGIDDYGYPLGYNGWTSSLKLSALGPSLADRTNIFVPSAHDLSHVISAAKNAAHEVFLAQQHVNAAKEDVLYAQKSVKEKENQALIAHQKSESAQKVLRNEAQHVVLAQEKLAKAKAFAAELQLKQAYKNAEAAKALQSSANYGNSAIQKAEHAAKFNFFKHSIDGPFKPASFFPVTPAAIPSFYPAPWAAPVHAPLKPLTHHFNSY